MENRNIERFEAAFDLLRALSEDNEYLDHDEVNYVLLVAGVAQVKPKCKLNKEG